jgi:hypothetical protein
MNTKTKKLSAFGVKQAKPKPYKLDDNCGLCLSLVSQRIDITA